MKSMPRPEFSPTEFSFDLEHLKNSRKNELERSHNFPPSTWVMGFRIPPFQRPLVWTEAQMTRFVGSIWKGRRIGSYVVNDVEDAPMTYAENGSFQYHPMHNWLIDGQQRLNALKVYFDDGIPFPSEDGSLAVWSDLNERSQRYFLRTRFTCDRISLTDEALLRECYDDLNFGGTAHTEDQRAVPLAKKAAARSLKP